MKMHMNTMSVLSESTRCTFQCSQYDDDKSILITMPTLFANVYQGACERIGTRDAFGCEINKKQKGNKNVSEI